MSRRLVMLAVLSIPSLAATGCLGMRARHAATAPRPAPATAAAAPAQLASQPAATTLADVEAIRHPGWPTVIPAVTVDLAALASTRIPVVAGQCYDVLVALDAGSAWPSRTAPLAIHVDGTTRALTSHELAGGAGDSTGPFDARHPYADSGVFCAATDGVAELAPTPPARASSVPLAPARAEVHVLSRDLLEVAAESGTPDGWPADFLLLPGRLESDSTGGYGALQVRAIRIQTTITSPEIADLFYRRVAERAGLRLTQHAETAQPDGPTAYTRTFRGHGQTWEVYFFRAVTSQGSLGTVTSLQTVSSRSARAQR